MNKINKIIILLLLLTLLPACHKLDNSRDNNIITLTGFIKTHEIFKDGQSYQVSILNLNQPIIINGTSIKTVSINSNQELTDNSQITLNGILQSNDNPILNTSYSFTVLDIPN